MIECFVYFASNMNFDYIFLMPVSYQMLNKFVATWFLNVRLFNFVELCSHQTIICVCVWCIHTFIFKIKIKWCLLLFVMSNESFLDKTPNIHICIILSILIIFHMRIYLAVSRKRFIIIWNPVCQQMFTHTIHHLVDSHFMLKSEM